MLEGVAVVFATVALGTVADPDKAADMAGDVLLTLEGWGTAPLVCLDCAKTCACVQDHRATRSRRNRRICHLRPI